VRNAIQAEGLEGCDIAHTGRKEADLHWTVSAGCVPGTGRSAGRRPAGSVQLVRLHTAPGAVTRQSELGGVAVMTIWCSGPQVTSADRSRAGNVEISRSHLAPMTPLAGTSLIGIAPPPRPRPADQTSRRDAENQGTDESVSGDWHDHRSGSAWPGTTQQVKGVSRLHGPPTNKRMIGIQLYAVLISASESKKAPRSGGRALSGFAQVKLNDRSSPAVSGTTKYQL